MTTLRGDDARYKIAQAELDRALAIAKMGKDEYIAPGKPGQRITSQEISDQQRATKVAGRLKGFGGLRRV